MSSMAWSPCGEGRLRLGGELFNEVPDRVSDVAIQVGAGYAFGSSPTLGFSAALAAVLTAYVRAQSNAVGAPQEYCGPMAKPQRMVIMAGLALICGVVPMRWHRRSSFMVATLASSARV